MQHQIVERGIKSLLEEAKVPMRVHLKVVEALQKAFKDHTKDRTDFRGQLDAATNANWQMMEAMKQSVRTAEHLRSVPHLKGEPGNPGRDGNDGVGTRGKDGISPSIEDIVAAVLPRIPKAKDGKNADPVNMETIINEVIKSIQKGDKLHISHVKGATGFIKDGIKYRYEELMHGSGTSSGGANVATQLLPATQVSTNITLDLTGLTHTFSGILFVTRNGQVLMPNGSAGLPGSSWTISGNTITVYNASDSDVYLVQYTYA